MMLCPICQTPQDENGLCPNCGTATPEAIPAPDAAPESSYGHCPVCKSPLNEDYTCPDCGLSFDPEVPTIVTEADVIPDTGNPGIYYDNLLTMPAEVEEAAPADTGFRLHEKLIMAGSCLLLAIVIILSFVAAGQFDPDSPALKGPGDIYMDNRTFSIYYSTVYQDFLSQYGESLPFDPERSLKRQYYNADLGYSWEEYFITQAFSTAAVTEQMLEDAARNGFTMEAEMPAKLESALGTLESAAAQNRMDARSYLKAMFGEHMTLEAYTDYLEDTILAQGYSDHLYTSIHHTDQEITDYYYANASTFSGLTVSSVPNVNVRHMMFVPTDATLEAVLVARQNAESAKEQCLSGGEEQVREMFLQLVPEYSQDSGSNMNGGLLENVAPGMIGGGFDTWCFDENRHEPGDMEIVTSQYGFHLVYFENYRDNYYWKEAVLSTMRTQAMKDYISSLSREMPCELTRFTAVP